MRPLRSHSEIETFKNCALQHVYRYHMGLESRAYADQRDRVIGGLLHTAKENLYLMKLPAGRAIERDLVRAVVEKAADVFRAQYAEFPASQWFDPVAFEIDVYVAYRLAVLFAEVVFPEDTYELVAAEHAFEVQIGDYMVRGFIDQIFRATRGPLEGRILPGEVKTRAATWSASLERIVPSDAQVRLYHVALQKEGMNPAGTVYTVYKKPPKPLLLVGGPDFASTRQGMADRLAAIDAHYAKNLKHSRRAEVDHTVAERALVSDFSQEARMVDRFYAGDPYIAISQFNRPPETRFPCTHCDYFGLCRRDDEIDSRFIRRRDR